MRSRILAALLLLGLASCGVLRSFFGGAEAAPRLFNHEAHIVRGVGCLDCHEGGEKEIRAGLPSKAFCMNCHEDLDKEPGKPLEKKVAAFLDPAGNPVWSAFTRQSSEIKFSHQSHATAKVACIECHEGIDKDTGLRPGMLQRMDSCVSCHAARAPRKNDCVSCHASMDRTVAPLSHGQLWERRHGACAREGREVATSNDCAMCHRKDACTTCHQTRPPSDHDNFWRLKAHGVAASFDRSRCATCHASDSCSRCHQQVAPVSHGAGWNAPGSRHCASCHVPQVQFQGQGCAVCHKGGAPHPSAKPKPLGHSAASNCRACHGPTLKHLDNGDNCNACHR